MTPVANSCAPRPSASAREEERVRSQFMLPLLPYWLGCTPSAHRERVRTPSVQESAGERQQQQHQDQEQQQHE